MALLTIQHIVRDYHAWRAIYDALEEVRQDWGVIADSGRTSWRTRRTPSWCSTTSPRSPRRGAS